MIRLSVKTVKLLVDHGDFNAQSALNTHNFLKEKWASINSSSETMIHFDKNCIFEFRTYMKHNKKPS